ncbi:MAG: Type I restriction-modification system, specificity subunit S [Nitrospira sp.]|jgi:type I restriction enzyme S subunit|nr:MAG: Type I restriction-modification system, specificity subunit S [Nitrospira sp.]
MLDDTKARWPLKPLSEVVDLNPRLDKSAYRDDLEVSFVPMAAVEAGSGRMDVSQTKQFSAVKKGYTPFKESDVLFAKITPCMENGKMAVVPRLTSELGFGSTEFHVLRPHERVDSRFIYYFVSSQNFRREAAHRMTGAVGQKRVPQSFLEEALIPVPLFDDQRRIVAEIEKKFSRLDEAVANLKRVKVNLKRYKASVLKAAVEGKLTEAWRKQHPDIEPASKLLERILAERRAKWNGRGKYKEPSAPDTSALPELPDLWGWATMPQLGELNRGKSKHRPRNDLKLFGGPYPFIQTGDVKRSGGFVRSHSQTYNESGLAQSRLWPAGTLCITIAANIAETGILTYSACFPDSVVGFVLDSAPVTVRLIDLFFRTEREEIARFAPATAQKNINLEILSAVAIPIPPFEEQKEIVAEVERRLSVIDELEATVQANLTRAACMRHAILSQAFAGKLLSKGARG